jgi:hypothetical protein
MGAQVVPEQQRPLLGETARPAHMEMRPATAGWFPEIPLGPLGVVGPVHIPQLLQRQPVRGQRLKVGHRDLDIDDRLSGQAGHRGGADMVDPERDRAKPSAEFAAQLAEPHRPGRVICGHLNRLVSPAALGTSLGGGWLLHGGSIIHHLGEGLSCSRCRCPGMRLGHRA